MTINLHHLRIFAAVAEQRGFSRAAAALHISQPAVSKAVRQLERRVGVPLLERAGRASRLTAAGEQLAARARELFAVEAAAEEELRALRGLEAGSLRVGASTTIATYLLPPILARFHDAHPAIALRVVSANTRAITRALLERRLDVALVEGPVEHQRISARRWRSDELVLIAPPDHRLVSRRSVDARELTAERFVVREPGSGTREVAERALARSGVRPAVALQLGSTEAVKQAVAAGLGVAIVSRYAAEDQLALGSVALVRLRGVELERTLAELRLEGRKPSAPAAAFAQFMRA
ncbi:MAG TPA: LysR family transcriptional regulator [Gemmatimonadaceae bacterium]|nr:LysR family transcriptional regulator [Gemmatimonadaceae bacterium]